MIKIPLPAQVECTDGSAGRSTAVIINPAKRTMTHFSVQAKESLIPTARLVPIGYLAGVTADRIQLRCTRAELSEMEIFSETHYIQNEDVTLELMEPYMTPLDVNYMAVETENVPAGKLAVHPSTTVEAADGFVGTIGAFVIDSESASIAQMVLKQGHAWDKKERTIPAGAIDHISNTTIILKLNKGELAALPTITLKRDTHNQDDIDLLVYSFNGAATAGQGLDILKKLAEEKKIKLLNTALVTKDQAGKTTLKEAEDMDTARGALFGAIAGGIIGLLGGPVGAVVGAAAGAATGGAAAHWIDMGIANDDLKALQDGLDRNSSAIVVLVARGDATHVTDALAELGGESIQQTVTNEMIEQILSERETEGQATEK